MGEAKRKQLNDLDFLKLPENSRCVYCGKKSENIDHFPPRAYFKNRGWPKGYRFPSCYKCNSTKSNDEQSLILLLKMQNLRVGDDDAFEKFVRGVRNNQPWVIREMNHLKGVAAKRARRKLFNDPSLAARFFSGGWGITECGEPSKPLFEKLLEWLGRTLFFFHYKEVHLGTVLYSVVDLKLVRAEWGEKMRDFYCMLPTIESQIDGKDISDQFSYRYLAADGFFSAAIQFGTPQFLFCVVICKSQFAQENFEQFWKMGKSPEVTLA